MSTITRNMAPLKSGVSKEFRAGPSRLPAGERCPPEYVLHHLSLLPYTPPAIDTVIEKDLGDGLKPGDGGDFQQPADAYPFQPGPEIQN